MLRDRPPSGGRRPGGAGRGDQPAERACVEGLPEMVTRGFVIDEAAAGDVLTDGATFLAVDHRRVLASRSGPTRACSRNGFAASSAASANAGRAAVRWCCRSSWRSRPTMAASGSTLSRRVSEVVGVALFAVRAHLADRARQLRRQRPRLVLQRPAPTRRRRTSPAASARSWPSCRSRCSATPRTCCRRSSPSLAGTTSGAAASTRCTRS